VVLIFSCDGLFSQPAECVRGTNLDESFYFLFLEKGVLCVDPTACFSLSLRGLANSQTDAVQPKTCDRVFSQEVHMKDLPLHRICELMTIKNGVSSCVRTGTESGNLRQELQHQRISTFFLVLINHCHLEHKGSPSARAVFVNRAWSIAERVPRMGYAR